MSITDELRKWLKSLYTPNSGAVKDEGERIADRIDAEHERLMQEQPFTIDMVPMTDERMADHGWIRLPKDADGDYIHVGDVMEWPDGETFEVVGIGDGTLFYVEGDDDALADWTGASTKHHHHATTVEDVLREFANEVYADADNEIRDRDFLCAKYAKRLTLAEGVDA